MALTVRYASSAGGGAHDGTTEADAWSFAEMLTNATAGQIVNFKGSHTLTGAAAWTNAGTGTSPIKIRGYATTAGDGYLGRTNDTGELITTNFAVWDCGTNYYNSAAKARFVLECIWIKGTSNGPVGTSHENGVHQRCRFENTSTNASADAFLVDSGGALFYDSDIILSGASGTRSALRLEGATTMVVNCRIDGGPSRCVWGNAGSAILVKCAIYKGGGSCIYLGASFIHALFCTIVGAGSSGYETVDGITANLFLIGCIWTDNGAYGVKTFDADIPCAYMGNRADRNTSGNLSGSADWREATDIGNDATSATQANEYVDYATDDFTLKTTSPGYAGAAWPFEDIGAIQHEDPASGGGGGPGPRVLSPVGSHGRVWSL